MGSNLGDKKANCQSGIRQLTADGKIKLVRTARYYRTEPVDYLDQDWFVNTAIEVRTSLMPQTLLFRSQAVQTAMGRQESKVRFGPRTLDLDILFYDDVVLEIRGLILPHPRLHQRRFVLQPMCDIAPMWCHPLLKKNVEQLLAELSPREQQVIAL